LLRFGDLVNRETEELQVRYLGRLLARAYGGDCKEPDPEKLPDVGRRVVRRYRKGRYWRQAKPAQLPVVSLDALLTDKGSRPLVGTLTDTHPRL
jgi:hypothetical protein